MGKNKVVSFFLKGLIVLLGAIVPLSVFQYRVDPYSYFRLQDDGQIYVPIERYQIPGLARNENYDTVILGSSMIENFSEKYVSEKLGVKAIKLPINASYVTEQRMVLDMAEKYHEVKNVLWVVDYRTVDIHYGDVYEKEVAFPFYMYDENPLNDWKYLLNQNNFFLSLKQLYMRKTGVNLHDYYVYDRETLNTWNWKRFSKDLIAEDYRELYYGRRDLYLKINNLDEEAARETIDKTVLDAAAQYPDTQFYLVLPPKPILWYKLLDQKGILEKKLSIQQYLTSKAESYPNVKVYNFQNSYEITENLDLYLDITHYSQVGNKYMADAISEGRNQVDAASFQSEAQELLAYVRSPKIESLAQGILDNK